MKPTLALDLARKTGWAVLGEDGLVISSGTFHVSTDKEDKEQRQNCGERFFDVRFAKLMSFINDTVQTYGITRIVFEDVQFASSVMQVQLWTTFRAAIWACVATTPLLSSYAISVGTLKKFATKRGDAEKEDMLQALIPVWESVSGSDRSTDMMDDNEVDAIWMALYAAAVDRGEEDFLGPYTRRMGEKKELREKKAMRKKEAGKCPQCKAQRKLTSKNIVCKCGFKEARVLSEPSSGA